MNDIIYLIFSMKTFQFKYPNLLWLVLLVCLPILLLVNVNDSHITSLSEGGSQPETGEKRLAAGGY